MFPRLSIRLIWVESLVGGLDKAYRLHKWLGVTSLIFSSAHFLLANIPKIMVDAGWLAQPPQTENPESTSVIFQFFLDQQALAEEFGDWGFKVAVVLILIALVKWFPYRFFFQSHRLLSVVYLFLVFHSVALMKFDYWSNAIAPLSALLMVGGTVAAVTSLLGRVGAGRRALGKIERLQFHEDNSVLKIGVKPIEFFRDMIPMDLAGASNASFSVCRVEQRPLVIDVTEYHSSCTELNIPLDSDLLMHVGPATPNGVVPLDAIEVFRVPKGTCVTMRPGVWHHAPFVTDADEGNCLVVLPERTYANDCEVYEIPEADQIAIQT